MQVVSDCLLAIDAVRRGDSESLRGLVSDDLLNIGIRGHSLMHIAVGSGYGPVVEVLYGTFQARDTMVIAAYENKIEMARLLLRLGATVTPASVDVAVDRASEEMVTMYVGLVKDKSTIPASAVSRGVLRGPAFLRHLLEANMVPAVGPSPLYVATSERRHACLSMLVSRCELNVVYKGARAIDVAVIRNDVPSLRLLSEAGANTDGVLVLASEHGHLDVMKAAKVYSVAWFPAAMQAAARVGGMPAVRLLQSWGVPGCEAVRYGDVPCTGGCAMTVAADCGKNDVLAALIKGDKVCGQALNASLNRGNVDGFQILVKAGANVAMSEVRRCLRKSPEIFPMLMPYATGDKDWVTEACQGKHDVALRWLLANGFASRTGNLDWLLWSASVRCTKVLLDFGANPNMYNATYLTILQKCCAAGEVDKVILLLKAGATGPPWTNVRETSSPKSRFQVLAATGLPTPYAYTKAYDSWNQGKHPIQLTRDAVFKYARLPKDLARLAANFIAVQSRKVPLYQNPS